MAASTRPGPAVRSLRTVALYLVRHAVAIAREDWDGVDLDRPLDDEGRRQVDELRRWFAGRPLDVVLSSPALRCVATALPIADDHEVELGARSELLVDADLDAGPLLAELAGADAVLCTHGEHFPRLLGAFGLERSRDLPYAKGSLWTAERDGVHLRLSYTASPVDGSPALSISRRVPSGSGPADGPPALT